MDVRRFETDGYLVVRGLLDPERDLVPLRRAYEALIDALAAIYAAELGRSSPADTDAESPGARLARLLGTSGGAALHHLAPVLSVFASRFRWRGDLPTAQIPELFALLRHERLLDAVEALIGPEIYASPIYHLNMKLSRRDLDAAERIAAECGRPIPSRAAPHYGFEVGRTPWHMDAIAGLRDSHQSRIVIAWIPLTTADQERGALTVIPGSHRAGVCAGPFADDVTRRAVTVEAAPGDVVFMDNKLVHGGTENRADGEIRWACNSRYLPVGEPAGRPYLPGFVARSRAAPETELRNAYVWSTMWSRALAALTRDGLPVPNVATTSHDEAAAISRAWREATPDPPAWLRMRDGRTPAAVRRVGSALRRRITTIVGRR